jgi:uncharacterized GH25 family protein
VFVAASSSAHDIWIQPSACRVDPGAWIRLDLRLGNHGSGHRDFRLASKVTPDAKSLLLYAPDGSKTDLTSNLTDQGYGEKEGYWSARYVPRAEGLYTAVASFDQVMTYGPVRDVKSAKTFFAVGSAAQQAFDRVYGHAMEIVPMENPILAAAGTLAVKVLYKNKPLPGTKVTFVPMGATLKEGEDPEFENKTDDAGVAKCSFPQGDIYLIAARFTDPQGKGDGYEAINYSATLCLVVPNKPLR